MRIRFLCGKVSNHPHARNMTRRLIERGISENETEKILRGSWLQILEALL